MSQSLTQLGPSFRGRRVVALLEASPSELSDLLFAQDAVPLAVPAVSAALHAELEEVCLLIDELTAGQYELVLFMSGSAVSSLFECAEELGRRRELLSALRALTLACHGPKATAGLRRFGLQAKPESRAPLTTSRLLRAVQQLHLTGRGVLRINGEPGDTLANSLSAQRAKVREITLAQRRSPRDTAASEALLRMIVGGAVQALVVSCELQFLHLYRVARKHDLVREFVYALRNQVTVAVIGTSPRDVLEAHGVRPHPMPAQPQMLVMALMHFLETRAAALRGVTSPSVLPS